MLTPSSATAPMPGSHAGSGAEANMPRTGERRAATGDVRSTARQIEAHSRLWRDEADAVGTRVRLLVPNGVQIENRRLTRDTCRLAQRHWAPRAEEP